MLLGLNDGASEHPIGAEQIAVMCDLSVEVDRYGVPRESHGWDVIAASLRAWVGSGIRPQFLFHRIEQAHPTFVRQVVSLAMNLYLADGFDLEPVNEFRISTWE